MNKVKHKPQRAFGAINDAGWVAKWTINGTASSVRENVGRAWCKENPANGWKAARLDGFRVVKIELRVVG